MEDNQLIQARREKFATYAQMFPITHPNHFKPKDKAADLQDKYKELDKEALNAIDNPETHVVAGRVMLLRTFGKLAFAQIQDTSGRVQISLSVDGLGEESFKQLKDVLEIGDIIGAEGTMTRTNTGELTVKASHVLMINKTLRPLPEKWHGLSDKETRYRQRYVDLIVNEDVRDVFKKRSKAIAAVREYLIDQDFMEVETPMLHQNASGAAAKPFLTHHNALSMDMKLRIAPELHLKRLLVGGFDRVFEVNRNFRNEGVSLRHNPEFTMLEFYTAYADYEDAMKLTEELIAYTAQKVCGTTEVEYGEHKVSLKAPFKKLSMKNAILEIGGAQESDLETIETIKAFAASKGIKLSEWGDYGQCFLELFEELCEEKLIQPTFIYDYPTSTSPLSRCHDEDKEWTQRAELFVVGRELGNLFSELNDADDQEQRFIDQIEQAKKGNDEAMEHDKDYIRALEYGMPPAAGVGIGIDRLVMLITNQPSIREVLLFPHLRPEEGRQAAAEAQEEATA